MINNNDNDNSNKSHTGEFTKRKNERGHWKWEQRHLWNAGSISEVIVFPFHRCFPQTYSVGVVVAKSTERTTNNKSSVSWVSVRGAYPDRIERIPQNIVVSTCLLLHPHFGPNVLFTRPNRAARIAPRSSLSSFFFLGGITVDDDEEDGYEFSI